MAIAALVIALIAVALQIRHGIAAVKAWRSCHMLTFNVRADLGSDIETVEHRVTVLEDKLNRWIAGQLTAQKEQGK